MGGKDDIVKEDIEHWFGDKDKDGVINMLDCQPSNPRKHGLKPLPSYVRPTTRDAYEQLKSGGYDVSAYKSKFEKVHIPPPVPSPKPEYDKPLPSYVRPTTRDAYEQLKSGGYDVSAYKSKFEKKPFKEVWTEIPPEQRQKDLKAKPQMWTQLSRAEQLSPAKILPTIIKEFPSPKEHRGRILRGLFRNIPETITTRPYFPFGSPFKKGIRKTKEVVLGEIEKTPGYIVTQKLEEEGKRIVDIVKDKKKKITEWKPPGIAKYEIEAAKPPQLKPEAKRWESQLRTGEKDLTNLTSYAQRKGWVNPDGVIQYPDTKEGRAFANRLTAAQDTFQKTLTEGKKKYLTAEGYFKSEYVKEVPTPTGVEVQRSISGKYLLHPLIIEPAVKGIEWYEKRIEKPIREFYEREPSKEETARYEKIFGKPKGITVGTPHISKEIGMGAVQVPPALIGLGGVLAPTVTEMAFREPEMLVPFVAYEGKEMGKYAIEHPIEFATTIAIMGPIMKGVGKISPVKYAKVDISPRITWRGVGLDMPFKDIGFKPIVGVVRKGKPVIGEPFKMRDIGVPKVTKIKGEELFKVDIPKEGFERTTLRKGKIPAEVRLKPEAALEMETGIGIMQKFAKIKPEVKRPLREAYIERIPKKAMPKIENVLRKREHVVYGSVVEEMFLKKAPKKAHDIDLGLRAKDIPTVRQQLIHILQEELGRKNVRKSLRGEGIEVRHKGQWRHAVDIHPLEWQEAFHQAPAFGVKLRPWEKVDGITTVSLGEQWVKKGTTWLVPEYAVKGELGLKAEWRLKDVPSWSKISREVEASVSKAAKESLIFKPLKGRRAKVLSEELANIRAIEAIKHPEIEPFLGGAPYDPYMKPYVYLRDFPHVVLDMPYPPMPYKPTKIKELTIQDSYKPVKIPSYEPMEKKPPYKPSYKPPPTEEPPYLPTEIPPYKPPKEPPYLPTEIPPYKPPKEPPYIPPPDIPPYTPPEVPLFEPPPEIIIETEMPIIEIPPTETIPKKPPVKPKKKKKKKPLTIEEKLLEEVYRKRKYPTLSPSEMLKM